MNSRPFKPTQHTASQRGIALVLVLGMLVLLSGLLVAFLTTATTERTATQSASDGASARQIADSTINLVIGQIREGTSSVDLSTGKPNEKQTWASQPGAIRTYSGQLSGTSKYPAGGGTYPTYTGGKDDFVFKLYSSDRLKVTASDYASRELPLEVKVIENWNRIKPDPEYVDLNEPILSPRYDLDESGTTVEPRFPIIDPRARYTKDDKFNTNPTSAAVEGFDAKLIEDKNLKVTNSTGGKAGESLRYLPLPVKWLYVLRDGSVGAAELATETNPIVGRTAFWTDDESCKLNINTASEGTFWDTPTASSIQETGLLSGNSGTIDTTNQKLSFAASQPVKGEYQRYPGHPMTTSLSPVFGWLYNLNSASSVYPDNSTYQQFKEAIYQISPFLASGRPTTQGATWNSDPDASGNASPSYDSTRTPNPLVRTKHLYATVDELLFVPERNDGKTDPKGVLNGKLTPQAMEKMRFFLTATSRAPDVNLFGRPRVTVWPVHENFDLRTAYDDLFAFTSTIYKDPEGNLGQDKKFHLTRSDAKDDRTDYNAQNKLMYQYLQSLTGGAGYTVPGFGGTFLQKYGPDRNQILTEVFDYMRTVNISDTGTASRTGNVFVPYTPTFFPKNVIHNYTRQTRSIDWSGQVTPLKVDDDTKEGTMGLGRFLTISEAAILFNRVNVPNTTPVQQGVQAVLLLEMATPMGGFPGLRDTYWTVVRPKPDPQRPGLPLRKMEVVMGSQPPQDAFFCTQNGLAGLVNIVNVSNHEVTQGRAFMPILGYTNSLHYFLDHKGPTNVDVKIDAAADPNRVETASANPLAKLFTFPIPNANFAGGYVRGTTAGTGTVANYPYISRPIPIPTTPATTTLNFIGPSLIVEIWTGEAPDGNKGDKRSRLVQTIELDFPTVTANIPLPTASTPGPFRDRFDGSLEGRRDNINYGGAVDVVRSIELTGGNFLPANAKGDIRIVAARRDVPGNFYEPRGGVAEYNSTKQRVHGLQSGHGEGTGTTAANNNLRSDFPGAGTFAAGGNYRLNKPSILPVGINGVKRADGGPGDWDRGVSKHMDGAMANKVDEGNLKFDYNDNDPWGKLPYFRGRGLEETGQSFFSPNRQFPSPVMFGSLPTGVKAGKPWQTLLFRPDRETGPGHPGAKTPPDHLWLDLFHMPVVEPFAISEPFSTMGKVNMNYVIAPFGYAKGDIAGGANNPNTAIPRSYVRRDTAVRGVLKSVFMMMVPTGQPDGGHAERATEVSDKFRYPINLDKTLEEFETRLNDQRTGLSSRPTTLFRSASEICEIDLFPLGSPAGATVNNFATFWDQQYAQTGDNMRERPYAHIYPRLTTKSNVFTVYMRCQAIRKSPKSKPNEFDPTKDTVAGEYRGSATIERFIDPNDQQLKDYKPVEERLEPYYRYRIVGTKHFAPR